MTNLDEACPIWGTVAVVESGDGNYKNVCSPRAGGRYRISGAAEIVLRDRPEHKSRLTTWLVDQRRMGVDLPDVTTEALDRAARARPLPYSARRRRSFEWLAAIRTVPGSAIRLDSEQDLNGFRVIEQLTAWIEAETIQETAAFARMLADGGYLKPMGNCAYEVTEKGFEAIEEIGVGGAATDQGFVAMWFDPTMITVYDEGFARGIARAGFRPFRIDGKETVGKIDDEIIAEIRRSRFVVADFTAGSVEALSGVAHVPRGGVYFEAGFALGLGTPVIWTARRDCIAHVHFDTRQFAHIVWTNPFDLADRLAARIGAVIGQGPNLPAT